MEFFHFICLISIFIISLCFSQNYDKENLKKLTEYRQQHRKTVDGRLCAAAFVQDDHTYTDCTKATDPNGITGKDWCYVEVQLIGKGNRDWDYCKGVVNYDVVRSKARSFFQAKANELSSAVNKLDVENKKLVSIYEKYQEVCGTTSELLKKKIQEINDVAKNSSRNINKLLLLASTIGETEKKMYELIDEVEKNRKAFLENKKNCGVLKGYIVEERADGLLGSYYDNAYFAGYPVSISNDKYINFVWDTGVPIETIPYQHFSIRWDGYLKIPQTDNYIITIEHDCGVRIFLDDSPIIVNNMPYPKEDESAENRPISILHIEKINANVHKTHSEKLGLVGGKKYKFRLEYFHLSTIKYKDPDTAHIILYWKSNNIAEEIIPTNYFFQGNITTPLRITELKGDEFEISLLENGSSFFMNSSDYIIADVPTIHEKSKCIKTLNDFNRKNVRFKINVYSTVFIAIPQKNDAPFNEVDKNKFVYTKETLSVYQIQNIDTKASKQEIYNIYSSDYHNGEVIIALSKPTPFIIFVEQKELRSTNSCRGYVQAISLTNSVYFDSCYTSSYESDKFDCNAGFSGKNREEEYSTWKTAKNKSLGQYVSISFKNDIDIHSFTFKTLTSTENAVTEISLYFPNIKNPEIFLISPGHHHYKLKIPIKTKTIKAVISKVNDSKKQSGGNITFYGIPCIDPNNKSQELEKKNQHEINIFFRNKNINILKPLNWQIDNGLTKQSHGVFKYGWEKLPTPIPIEHLDKNDISRAGISFRPLECTNDACDTFNKWSIDLLHEGLYYVTIEIGSPIGRQELNSINVNGRSFINDIFLKPGQYTKVTADINIKKNKTLEVSTNTNTVIQSIQILFLNK